LQLGSINQGPGVKAFTFLATSLVLGIGQPLLADDALAKTEIAKIGKASTALIHLPDSHASGSGFCIHPAGFFITNAHVVAPGGRINLVLGSGTRAQKVYPCKLLRTDKEQDLALLSVAGNDTFKSLPLGSDEKLTELEEVIAFGFPFGSALSVNKKDYPAVSINSGSVTALRFHDQRLDKIQLDAAVNPGSSGGPVLDRSGKVIGVVVSGVRASGVNFAIPVSKVFRFVSRPEVVVTPPTLSLANVGTPAKFSARVMSVLPEPKPLSVELTLTAGGGASRKLSMTKSDDQYQVVTAPAPRPNGPRVLRLSADFGTGSVDGLLDDCRIRINGKEMQLSEIQRFESGPTPEVFLTDGTTLTGKPTGLEAAPIKLGNETVLLNLVKAQEFSIASADAVTSISYTVTVIRDGAEVATLSDRIPVTGAAVALGRPGRPLLTGARAVVTGKNVKMVELPSTPIASVAVGGGGNYLVLHLPGQKKLAIFDVMRRRLAHSIDLSEDKALFAAGASKLMILYPASGIVERWALRNPVKEASSTLVMKVPAIAVTMGSASEGPLTISGSNHPILGETVFLDIWKLQRIEKDFNKYDFIRTGPEVTLRASADGKFFVCREHTSSGLEIIAWDGERFNKIGGPGLANAAPGPDGKVLYSEQGRYSIDGKKLDGASSPCVPAQRGDYYVSLKQVTAHWNADIYREGEITPVSTVESIELGPWELVRKPPLSVDRRIHLVPEAKLLIVIPSSNDRLLLYPLDV
jgi:S1-C subfamily serine protease